MFADTSWLTILAAILLVRWLGFEAVTERATRRGDALVFRAPLGLRLLFGVSLPGMVYAAGAVALSENGRADWWLSAMFLFFASLIAFVWPPDISVSNEGISERKWLGLRKRIIHWNEVEYATANPSDDSLEVVSKSGFTIKHTKYHAGRADFAKEVKDRCGLLDPMRGLK